MPEIEFVGDWEESQAQAIASQLRKSLDADAVEPSIPQLEDNPVGLLSKRQKRLIELLRQGGMAAFQAASSDLSKSLDSGAVKHECKPDCAHDWSLYEPLEKAIKRDKEGRTYRLNENSRWERWDGGHQWDGGNPDDAEFRFITESGEFGRGVYFDVAANPGGWLRLRLSVDAMPSEMVTDERFYELESDFTTDLALMLTHQGVKAVAKTEGDRVTRLMVRNSSDIDVLGAIAGSGRLPDGGQYRYQLVSVRPEDDRLIVDVEVAPKQDSGTAELTKAAVGDRKRPFSRESGLAGTPVVAIHGAKLDRELVRAAVDRCKLDGVDFTGVQVCLTGYRPDFVSETASAFCLPGDGVVMLLHHEPGAAISRFTRMLTHRLKSAAAVGAVGADEALELLHQASQLSPEWWLEMLIKRYVGAVHVARVECLMAVPSPVLWTPYLNLLAYRGLSYWGSRRAIAECQAEDYRVAHDPAGLPNLTTLLWDVAVPSVARMCQQSLVSTLSAGVGDGRS